MPFSALNGEFQFSFSWGFVFDIGSDFVCCFNMSGPPKTLFEAVRFGTESDFNTLLKKGLGIAARDEQVSFSCFACKQEGFVLTSSAGSHSPSYCGGRREDLFFEVSPQTWEA